MSQAPGHIVLGIEQLLAVHKRMTRAEIWRALGVEQHCVGSVLSRMNRSTPKYPRRIYIIAYKMVDSGGGRRYPRAEYALGNKRNAPKPKTTATEHTRRYRAKLKANFKVNSVFAYAQSLSHRAPPAP